MVASWLILIVMAGAIAAGVIVATILLGNRHTRGAMQFGAIGLVLLVALIVVWKLAVLNPQPAFANNAHLDHERTLIENQATYFDELARTYEEQEGVQAQHFAEQFREQARLTRSQMPEYNNFTVSSTQQHGRAFFLFSPAILIVFLVIVFLLFKHAGPGVGMTALALPVVVLFFGYTRVQRSTQHAYNQPQPIVMGEHWLGGMDEAPAGEIKVSLDTQSTDVAASEPVTKAEPAVAEVADAAEFVSIANVSTDAVASDAAEAVAVEAVEDPVDDGPTAATPIEEIPDWVRHPPKSAGNVHRQVAESGWYDTSGACRERLVLEPLVKRYLQDLAAEEVGKPVVYVPQLRNLGITNRYIRDRIIQDQYYEVRDFDHQEGMTNLHVLLEYDAATSDDLLARWRDYTRRGIVKNVAAAMGAIMVCLTGVLGLVKLDTYTKGYYTKRLFIGVPAAIIGIGFLISIFK